MSVEDAAFLNAALARMHVPVNPADLPRVDRHMVVAGPQDGMYPDAGDAVREFWRYGASFHDDPDNVGLFHPAELGQVRYESPPSFIAAASDAVLAGYRTVITQSGQFFTDEAYVQPAHFQAQIARIALPDEFSNEATGLRPAGEPGRFRLALEDRALRHIKGSAVFLGSDEPLSYGSFLFRVLPKVRMMRDMGLLGLPCIAYAQQKPYRDLLVLAGVPDSSLVLHDIGGLTRVDRVLVPGLSNPNAYIDPESRAFFSELRDAHGGMGRGRRIYVSRLAHNTEGWSTRVMVNEAELIVHLTMMGFDIIEPERVSVQEQIALFASADLVVGPSGSAMFNTVFCRPGTKVIDLQSEKQWIYSYAGMYASLQLDYGIFVGKAEATDGNAVHRRWSVNIDALTRRIDDFLHQPPRSDC